MSSRQLLQESTYGKFLKATRVCDHRVQFYERDDELVDALETFVTKGLVTGEASVVIATPEHRQALRDRLAAAGINIDTAINDRRYAELDAAETLGKFLYDEWPDPVMFEQVIREVLISVRGSGRNVRAFGEMVALLWESDHHDAAVRLEHLWNNLINAEDISLFCAYPSDSFDLNDPKNLLADICAAHTTVVGRPVDLEN